MCEPATLTALQMAGSVLGSGMQFQQQQEAADAQNAANEEQRRQLRQQQERDAMDSARARSQQWETDAAETNQYAMEHRKAFATFDALVGEGAGGVTAQRKLATMSTQQGQDMATLASNSTKARSEISLGENGRAATTNNQIASIKDVKGPSPLGMALQIGGAGLDYERQMKPLRTGNDALQSGVNKGWRTITGGR